MAATQTKRGSEKWINPRRIITYSLHSLMVVARDVIATICSFG